MLFEKFGEFDSVEELNMAAEGLKKEGDIESLKTLARENGIDPEDVEDYADGMIESLVLNPTACALAKIAVETEEKKELYQDQELINDWIGQIKQMAIDSEEFARAIRKKDKRLKECIAEILKWSFGNQVQLDSELLKAAGVNAGRVTMGVPGMRTAKELIRKYYLG